MLVSQEHEERIDRPVSAEAIDRQRRMPEVAGSYEPAGMAPRDFIGFGATQRTLSQFPETG